MDVGENTATGDGDSAQKLVELLVVLDGKGDVAGDNAGLLVVAGGVSGELKDLGAKVLEDGGHVDTGSHTDAGSVSTLLEVASQTGNRELKSGLAAGASALSGLSAASFSFSCEDRGVCVVVSVFHRVNIIVIVSTSSFLPSHITHMHAVIIGPCRESNPGPPLPERGIIPLDHTDSSVHRIRVVN